MRVIQAGGAGVGVSAACDAYAHMALNRAHLLQLTIQLASAVPASPIEKTYEYDVLVRRLATPRASGADWARAHRLVATLATCRPFDDIAGVRLGLTSALAYDVTAARVDVALRTGSTLRVASLAAFMAMLGDAAVATDDIVRYLNAYGAECGGAPFDAARIGLLRTQSLAAAQPT